MRPTDVQYFESAQDFRAWLLERHATSTPIWVAVAKRGCAHHVLVYQEALDAALCFGWIDGIVGRVDGDHYALRFSPRRPRSNWSVVNVRRFGQLKVAGVVHPSGLVAFDSRDRAVSEEEPAELAFADLELFKANAAAWAFFAAQPQGYRRQASWYVLSARTVATRRRRLAKVIELSALEKRLPGFG
jgi:uncharacterized protein YdeI (YjbR/CyaY-like superfamily)